MSDTAMVLAAGQPEEGDAMLVFMEKAGRTFDMLINSGTSLLPSNIQSVGDCVIASAFGRRFGMDPMASIYNIHIIEGRPQLRADAIVGLCKARREVCKYFMLVESSGLIATYETHRVGEPAPTRMSFTYAEAEAADLTKPTKTGKPSNWKRFPAAMCRARAGVALARAVYPDIVGGIYYPGELNDDEGFVGVEGVPDVMVPAQKAQRTPPAVIEGVRPAATVARVQHPLERPAIAEPFDDAEVDEPAESPSDNRPLPNEVAPLSVWWAYDVAQGKDPDELKTLVPKHARNRAEKLNRFLGFMRNGQGKSIGRPGILNLAERTAEDVPTATIETMLARLEVSQWSELGGDHLAGFVAALLRERERVTAAKKG